MDLWRDRVDLKKMERPVFFTKNCGILARKMSGLDPKSCDIYCQNSIQFSKDDTYRGIKDLTEQSRLIEFP
jgi:hypothetical protein